MPEVRVGMRRLGNNYGRVIVVALARAPWKLNPDTLRRFNRRVHFGLPDRTGRLGLLKLWFGSNDDTSGTTKLSKGKFLYRLSLVCPVYIDKNSEFAAHDRIFSI